MVFITAGMGGGTGTGASHVIARAAKELNILTVGVVTLPFSFEGPKKMRIALQGIEELKKHLDTNIIVPNQNLFKIINEKTTLKNSFGLSNDVLKSGVQSVTDLMVKPSLVNLDFADVETIMKGMGKAMMGTGEAEGEKRAEEATNAALLNPLIDEYSLRGAKGLLVNITGGTDLTLFEVDEAVNKIRAEVDPEAELIFGAIEDENLTGKIRVSIVATSLDGQEPETKPVVSMIHRLHNRNTGYGNNSTSILATNQATLNATEGATALDLNNVVDENKIIQQRSEQEEIKKKSAINSAFENISMENAAYLQNTENVFDNQDSKSDNKLLNFEVDSIELATPELFSDKGEENSFNQDNNESELEIFESSKSKEETEIKEPEMFEETNLEEDFEIPAFLRRQKN
jgi:cell division protein FtsZ